MTWNTDPDPFNLLSPDYEPIRPDPSGPSHGHQPPQHGKPCEVTTTNPNYCPHCLHDYGTGHHACNC